MNDSSRLTLEEAVKLHGHKGPWLIIGYKAGLRACDVLKPKNPFSLFCIIYTPIEVPYTCAVDGIQAATQCTIGKLNIELKGSDVKNIRYIFIDRMSGRKLEIRLKRNIVRLIMNIDRIGLIKLSKIIEEELSCNLFEEKIYD